MLVYLARRIVWFVPTILATITITFILMQLVPGGPFDFDDGGTMLPPAVKKQLEAQYNLDKPVIIQYFSFLGNLVTGDLGISFSSREDVSVMIARSLPISVRLGGIALAFALLVGLPLGILGGIFRNSWIDHLCSVISISGFVLPSFVLGIFMILLFSLQLHWLPVSGWGRWQHYVMPAIALGASSAALLARYTRSSITEVLRLDFIRVARAKGLSSSSVYVKHALRNALLPVLTILGMAIPSLLVGSFLIETMFSVPGTGRFFVDAIGRRDYPVVMGVALLYSVIVVVSNLITDLLYAVVDPRVRFN